MAAANSVVDKVHEVSHLLIQAANQGDYKILDQDFDEQAKGCICGMCYEGRDKFKAGLGLFFKQLSNPTVSETDSKFIISANYFHYEYTTMWTSSTTEHAEVHMTGNVWGRFNAHDKVAEFNFGCTASNLNTLKVTFADIHDDPALAQEKALSLLVARKFDVFGGMFAEKGVFAIPGLLHATGPADITRSLRDADEGYGALRMSHFAQESSRVTLGGTAAVNWSGVLRSAETGRSLDPEKGIEVEVPRVLQQKSPGCVALVKGTSSAKMETDGSGKIASMVLLADEASTRKAFNSCFHKPSNSEL